jgi:hypothetical protein
MPADQFAPAPVPVAVDPPGDHGHRGRRASGVHRDGVAVAAAVFVDGFDAQRVIPAGEQATVLMGVDRPVVVVHVEHLDGVPVGGDHVERPQPSRAALAGAQRLRSPVERRHPEQALAHVEKRRRRLHRPPDSVCAGGQGRRHLYGLHGSILRVIRGFDYSQNGGRPRSHRRTGISHASSPNSSAPSRPGNGFSTRLLAFTPSTGIRPAPPTASPRPPDCRSARCISTFPTRMRSCAR